MGKRGQKHDRTGRTKGAKLQWLSCHVELNNGFRQERAWKDLSASARVVYVELKSLYNGFNNGKVEASVRKLARLTGLANNTVFRALKNLQEAGFIVEMKRGFLGPDGLGVLTLWRLTEKPWLGERATNDFKSWKLKNITPSPKWVQGVPKMGTGKARSVPKMGTGCTQNEYREGPKNAVPCTQNRYNIIDVPEGAGKPDTSGPAKPSPENLESKDFGKFSSFAVVTQCGAARRVGVRTQMRGALVA